MVYDTKKTKFSGFTKFNSIDLNDRAVGSKNGGNANWPFQAFLDKFAEVYGASLRTFETESELIASDIQLDEYAIVEGTGYGLYKITNLAPTAGRDTTLTSGYTAKRESLLDDKADDYSDLRAKLAALTYKVGDVVYVKSAGLHFDVVDIGSNVDNSGTIITGGAFAAIYSHEGFVTPDMFEPTGEDSDVVQAAVDFCSNSGVALKYIREYICNTPIQFYGVFTMYGSGVGTGLKAGPNLAAAAKPTLPTSASTSSLSLAKVPILSNSGVSQFFALYNFEIDGGDEDVYGLYLSENFYGSIQDLWIHNTGGRPYTNLRGQEITHKRIAFYLCDDGVLTFNSTGFHFDTCGFERLAGEWSYDQRQPNVGFNKGSVSLTECWFEQGSSKVLTGGHFAGSGRGVKAKFFAAAEDTFAGLDVFNAHGADAKTVDGVDMTSAAMTMADVYVNDTTTGAGITFGVGANGNTVKGFFTRSNISDSGTGNNYLDSVTLAARQGVTNEFEVRSGTGVGVNDYVMRVVGDLMTLFGNDNNHLALESGILEIQSNGAMRIVSGGNISNQSNHTAKGNHYFSTELGSSDWEKGHIVMGNYHFWMNGADFRGSIGAPTSAGDGVIIATLT